MTSQHVTYFEEALGLTLERVERVLTHLVTTGQAWCFVEGQIIDRGFCERFIATAKDGKERKRWT